MRNPLISRWITSIKFGSTENGRKYDIQFTEVIKIHLQGNMIYVNYLKTSVEQGFDNLDNYMSKFYIFIFVVCFNTIKTTFDNNLFCVFKWNIFVMIYR